MTISRAPQRWLRIAVVVSALAFLLALVGLRGEPASAGPVARASRSASVDIDHFAFHPPTLTVAKGTTVDFSNSSKVTHTASGGGGFDSGLIRPGKSFAIRFTHRGTFAYHCEIHPLMHGKIIVD